MPWYKMEQEALENAQKDHRSYVEDFDGKNCVYIYDNNCKGWDTESRRCDCGNRRVDWVTYKNNEGLWCARAMTDFTKEEQEIIDKLKKSVLTFLTFDNVKKELDRVSIENGYESFRDFLKKFE